MARKTFLNGPIVVARDLAAPVRCVHGWTGLVGCWCRACVNLCCCQAALLLQPGGQRSMGAMRALTCPDQLGADTCLHWRIRAFHLTTTAAAVV
jgi:hypothetical protein